MPEETSLHLTPNFLILSSHWYAIVLLLILFKELISTDKSL